MPESWGKKLTDGIGRKTSGQSAAPSYLELFKIADSLADAEKDFFERVTRFYIRFDELKNTRYQDRLKRQWFYASSNYPLKPYRDLMVQMLERDQQENRVPASTAAVLQTTHASDSLHSNALLEKINELPPAQLTTARLRPLIHAYYQKELKNRPDALAWCEARMDQVLEASSPYLESVRQFHQNNFYAQLAKGKLDSAVPTFGSRQIMEYWADNLQEMLDKNYMMADMKISNAPLATAFRKVKPHFFRRIQETEEAIVARQGRQWDDPSTALVEIARALPPLSITLPPPPVATPGCDKVATSQVNGEVVVAEKPVPEEKDDSLPATSLANGRQEIQPPEARVSLALTPVAAEKLQEEKQPPPEAQTEALRVSEKESSGPVSQVSRNSPASEQPANLPVKIIPFNGTEIQDAGKQETLPAWAPVSEQEQTLLVFDACTLKSLSAPRVISLKIPEQGMDPEDTWLRLVTETSRLPNVRVAVPSFVAEWELMRQVMLQGADGKLEVDAAATSIVAPQSDALFYTAKVFRRFFEGASRLIVDDRGNTRLIPGSNPNIVITETPKDREMHALVRNAACNRCFSPPIRRDSIARTVSGYSLGDSCISTLLRNLPTHSPIIVISDDHHYLDSLKGNATCAGRPLGYANLTAYLAAEINARPQELGEAIGIPVPLNPGYVISSVQHYRSRLGSDPLSSSRLAKRDDNGLDSCSIIGEGSADLQEVIRTGVHLSRHPHQRPPMSQFIVTSPRLNKSSVDKRYVSAPAASEGASHVLIEPKLPPRRSPAPSSATFGEMIGALMADRDITFNEMARRVNAANRTDQQRPHMPPVSDMDILRIVSGQEKVLDEHLYAFIQLLISENDRIAEAGKPAAMRKMIAAAYQTAPAAEKAATGQLSDRQDYHTFGAHLYEMLRDAGLSDFREAAREFNKASAPWLRASEKEDFSPKDIVSLISGRRAPSSGMMRCIVRALGETARVAPEELTSLIMEFENLQLASHVEQLQALEETGRAKTVFASNIG